MDESRHKMPGAAKREAVKLRGLRGAKYLRLVRKFVRPLKDERACVNRKLDFDDLTNYTLLHFFNPALSSMRALPGTPRPPTPHRGGPRPQP